MKKTITIVSTICILLFISAIAIFASGIYIDKKNGTQKADTRFENLLNATKENFSMNVYGSSEFSNNFIRAIGNIDDFSTLKLEVNGTLVYSYPPSVFSLPSPELVKSYSETVAISDKSFTLKASIYLMSPGTIYNHSRLAFLLILVGTFIVGIFIVLTSGNDSISNESYIFPKQKKHENARVKKVEKVIKKEQPEPEEEEEEFIFSTEKPSKKKERHENVKPEKEVPAKEAKIEEMPEKPSPIFNPSAISEKQEEEDSISITFPEETPVFTKEDEELWNDEELFNDENENSAESENKSEENSELDIIDQMEQENQELSDDSFFADALDSPSEEDSFDFQAEEAPIFQPSEIPSDEELDFSGTNTENNAAQLSPITNIYLESALEQNLDESIKSEDNISFALVKINGLDRGNSISQNIISVLKTAGENEQAFEYKADSYAIILKDMNLQDSVDKFEEIYNKVADFLKDNNATNEVSIGLSSVSGRKITAERIIMEASKALDYASQDPDSPIVAFRANPEKYKELIENQ